jgi:hypothetical protein
MGLTVAQLEPRFRVPGSTSEAITVAKSISAEGGSYHVRAGTVRAQLWSPYAHRHLWAAKHFAAEAAELEGDRQPLSGIDGVDDGVVERHRACVGASLILNGAFLDSLANELFRSAVDHKKAVEPLGSDAIEKLAAAWTRIPREGPLVKLQKALKLTGNDKLDGKASPYKEANAAVALRNRLVHYEPEWTDAEVRGERSLKLFDALEGLFPLNPFTSPGNAFFPHKCISAGCARWAIDHTVAFADEFFGRMGLERPYANVLAGGK